MKPKIISRAPSGSQRPISRSRKWPTFSIRTLGLAYILFALFLATWMPRIRTQKQVIREVGRLGGRVRNISLDQHVVICDYASWMPTFLYPIIPASVNYVILNGEHIGNEHVAMAARLPNIQVLDLNFTVITDDVIFELQRCATLVELHLYDVNTVSEDAIADFHNARPDCKIFR